MGPKRSPPTGVGRVQTFFLFFLFVNYVRELDARMCVQWVDDGLEGETATPTLTPTLTPTKTPTLTAPERQQGAEEVSRTIVATFRPSDAGARVTITADLLTAIHDFEADFVNVDGISGFCLWDGNQQCTVPISVTQVSYRDGELRDLRFYDIGKELAKDAYRGIRGPNPTNLTFLRTYFQFGGPLSGFVSRGLQIQEQQDLWDIWWESNLYPHLTTVETAFNAKGNGYTVDMRGEPFGLLEVLWDAYKQSFAGYWNDQRGDYTFGAWPATEATQREGNFQENLRKLEWIGTLKPGASVRSLLNQYMHMTKEEFMLDVYGAKDRGEDVPHNDVWLMWNVQGQDIDYYYPPRTLS